MATIEVQGTNLTFSILPLKMLSEGFWARVEVGIENDFVDYRCIRNDITREELNEWIFAMFRLLAGGYGKMQAISFERAGIHTDLYPYEKGEMETSRQERRENDCIMTLRIRMDSEKKENFNGIYTTFLHRQDIEKLAVLLREEFNSVFAEYETGEGKYLFAGVSPKGYHGCNYWYLDPTNEVRAGDYVWVRMGRHQTEQIVYVDSVKRFDDDTAPFSPQRVKQVLRKATKEELKDF